MEGGNLMVQDNSTLLIDLLHRRSLSYEEKLEQIANQEEREQLKGVILGLKEAIEIVAKQDRIAK